MDEPYRGVAERCEILAVELDDRGDKQNAQLLWEADARIRELEAELGGGNIGVAKVRWTKPQAEENPAPLRPCPEEPEHLCCYPACNCAPQRVPFAVPPANR